MVFTSNFLGHHFFKDYIQFTKKYRIIAIILLFSIGYITRFIWLPFSIQAGCCATLFMYIGYLFQKTKNIFHSVSSETKIFITIFSLTMWLSFIKNFESFWLVHCDIGRGIIDILGCICACYIILLISKFIAKNTLLLKNTLSFLGKYSIFVLCIHIIELDLFPWNQLIQKFVSLGLPTTFELYVLIIGKFLFIIPFSIICANWNFTRNIFGLDDKKKN